MQDTRNVSVSLEGGAGKHTTILATPHGAQVLSWVSRGRERIFLSRKARFDAGAAIRGGIPVIFPQFGTHGNGMRHGFARLETWRREERGASPPCARFSLRESARSHEAWPHAFELVLEARPGDDCLEIRLTARNAGDAPFHFTAALHTYLRVDDIALARLHGLDGRRYLDAARGEATPRQAAHELAFEGEVDRIYPAVAGPLTLACGDELLEISQAGFTDVVVWNPGESRAAALPDLDEGEYRQFVCVEAAVIEHPVRLGPGQAWHGSQTLRLPALAEASGSGIRQNPAS